MQEPKDTTPPEGRRKIGRSTTDFPKAAERTKRKRTEHLRSGNSAEELGYAAQMKLREGGKVDAAIVVKDVISGSPTKAKKYRSSLELLNTEKEVLTSDEALSLFIEVDLSRNRYQSLRNCFLSKKDKILPPYKKLSQAKKECYPSEKILVTETSAKVSLQSLLDHTVYRILQHQNDVVDRFSEDQLKNLILICKWGCDGSSGHSRYKQKLSEENDSDESILFLALVPLQIVSIDLASKKSVIFWKNPRPSSPRFCRPINIKYARETSDMVEKEVGFVQKQIDELKPYEAVIHGNDVVVNYNLSLTMIDGKVCNALTKTTSAQRCFLCGATSKQFNNIDSILDIPISEENYRFGISSLHAWIRCFECLLHISYKLDCQTWQVRKQNEKSKVKDAEKEEIKKENKAKVDARKGRIQKEFKSKLFLFVDMPKQGFGSTNDGNTARRFFENYKVSAKITGLDKNLIYRFHIILQTITCGFAIDIDKFKEYTLDTARDYVKLYNWYYMPTSVHKLLIHGPEIVRSALLPIGQMSEEAQESCNKYFRKYRENFARKNFRQKTMEDVFNRFLISSDPYISSCRKLPTKRLKSLSTEVISLLSAPSLESDESLAEKFQFNTDSDSTTDASSSGPEDYSDEDGPFFL